MYLGGKGTVYLRNNAGKVRRHVGEELFKGFQAAGRGANAYNWEGIFPMRLVTNAGILLNYSRDLEMEILSISVIDVAVSSLLRVSVSRRLRLSPHLRVFIWATVPFHRSDSDSEGISLR
jgi:hypothetical protein